MTPPLHRYKLQASLDPRSPGVGCFDAFHLINHLRGAFPELVADVVEATQDMAAQFRTLALDDPDSPVESLIHDLQAAGPRFAFTIPSTTGKSIHGIAGRYALQVASAKEFPDEFRARFLACLRTLCFQPIQLSTEPPYPGRFQLKAWVEWVSEGVAIFDPVKVLASLRAAFPKLIQEPRNPLWDTCAYFLRRLPENRDGSLDALRIAVRDLYERGPAYLFKIPLPNGGSVQGRVEPYFTFVFSEEEFPEDFRRRFTDWLQGLRLQSIIVTEEPHRPAP